MGDHLLISINIIYSANCEYFEYNHFTGVCKIFNETVAVTSDVSSTIEYGDITLTKRWCNQGNG